MWQIPGTLQVYYLRRVVMRSVFGTWHIGLGFGCWQSGFKVVLRAYGDEGSDSSRGWVRGRPRSIQGPMDVFYRHPHTSRTSESGVSASGL